MISIALFLNIIVFGLAVALAISAIDFAVAACRCRSHVGDVLIFERSAASGDVYAPTNASEGEIERIQTRIDGGVLLRSASRVRRNTPAVSRRGPRATASLSYLTSNGLSLTPNVRPVHVSRASRRPSHPHAEYWRYGNPEFYAYM